MGLIQEARSQVTQEIINQIDDIINGLGDLSSFIEDEDDDEEYVETLTKLDEVSELINDIKRVLM